MKRYSDKLVQKAVSLRKKNRYSYKVLHRIMGVPETTIRSWCMEFDDGTKWDTILANNERKRQEFRQSDIGVVNSISLSDQEKIKLLTALLYWCEGSKYPSSTAVTMVNSDPELLRTFIHLFRKAFVVDELKFHIHLQIHTTHDYGKIKEYWSQLLHIPETQFMKPTITKPKGGKHRRQYLGTCTLKYSDYRILLKLMGIYEAFARKFSVE